MTVILRTFTGSPLHPANCWSWSTRALVIWLLLPLISSPAILPLLALLRQHRFSRSLKAKFIPATGHLYLLFPWPGTFFSHVSIYLTPSLPETFFSNATWVVRVSITTACKIPTLLLSAFWPPHPDLARITDLTCYVFTSLFIYALPLSSLHTKIPNSRAEASSVLFTLPVFDTERMNDKIHSSTSYMVHVKLQLV